MRKNSSSNKLALSVLILLCVLGAFFVALKLTGLISVGWLWVLSPLWVPIAAILLILLSIAVVIFISR